MAEILVVDDERDIADLFAMLLEAHGHQCAVASTGSHALEWLSTNRADVILLDIGLPDLDGYQVAQSVRASHGDSVYIAAVTGWGKAEDRERALAAGIDQHLTKPVDQASLLDVLSRALDRRR